MDKKRAEGQREMLLPISGAKASSAASKTVPSSKPKSTVRKIG